MFIITERCPPPEKRCRAVVVSPGTCTPIWPPSTRGPAGSRVGTDQLPRCQSLDFFRIGDPHLIKSIKMSCIFSFCRYVCMCVYQPHSVCMGVSTFSTLSLSYLFIFVQWKVVHIWFEMRKHTHENLISTFVCHIHLFEPCIPIAFCQGGWNILWLWYVE